MYIILTIVILNKKIKKELKSTIFILRAVVAKNQAGQIMTLSDSQVL